MKDVNWMDEDENIPSTVLWASVVSGGCESSVSMLSVPEGSVLILMTSAFVILVGRLVGVEGGIYNVSMLGVV